MRHPDPTTRLQLEPTLRHDPNGSTYLDYRTPAPLPVVVEEGSASPREQRSRPTPRTRAVPEETELPPIFTPRSAPPRTVAPEDRKGLRGLITRLLGRRRS